jgi:hypothetical protein
MRDRVILVEDDPEQSASIKAAVRARYRNAEVEILETEGELYRRVASLPPGGGDLRMVICDVMLPWAYPDRGSPKPPQEVVEGTFRKAGVRCWRKLRQRQDLRDIPWIYFTILDERAFEFARYSDDRTGYAQKANSIEPLLDEMGECFRAGDPWLESDEHVTGAFVGSPKMRSILLEGLGTPLAHCATSLP